MESPGEVLITQPSAGSGSWAWLGQGQDATRHGSLHSLLCSLALLWAFLPVVPALRKPACHATQLYLLQHLSLHGWPCLSAALYPHQTSFASPFLSLSHHVISLIPPTNTMEGTSARQTFICVEMVPKMTRFRKPDYTPPQCVTVQYQPGQARASLSACACDREHVTCGPGCG